MKKCLNYILIILCTCTCFLANAQQTFTIQSKVVEAYTEEPIFYTHLLNLRTLKGDVCDINGKFNIEAIASDTIRFSALGFKTLLIEVDDIINDDKSFKTIVLEKGIYELTEVLIRYIPPPEKFKEAFLELDIENPSEEIAKNLRLQEVRNQSAITFNPETGMPTYTISGPITYLYNKLSKKQRMLADSRIKLEKYNNYEKHLSNLAKIVTGFENKQEIDEFLKFCNLEVDFIKQYNDYDLVLVLNNYFLDYLSN